MLWVAMTVLGAVLGATLALRRGGRKLDALHYAAGFAIAFGLLGFALSVLIVRLA